MPNTTHLPQFGGVYFGLKNHEYKIVLNIVKKNFLIVFDANKSIKKLKRSFIIKKKSWNKLLNWART